MTHICHIRLLGSVQVETTAGLLQDFRSRKALALLAYLARHKYPVARSRLADLLWGDQPEARGRRNLSRELAYLSTILPDCFEADRDSIRFTCPDTCWVDAGAFDELAPPPRPGGGQPKPTAPAASSSLASSTPEDLEAQAARLAEAVALYRGDFLAGFYVGDCPEFEIWLLGEQEAWRQRVTGIFDCLTVYYGLHQQENQALLYARRWLELEPWQEVAHQHLMRLLARTGQRSAALAQYATCSRILADELGVEPAAETVALYEQIRTNEGGKEERPVGPSPTSADTLVQPSPSWGEAPDVSTFYGRKTELVQLQQWLVSEHCRLVVIMGIGGQGKTTLAAKTAKEIEAQFDIVIWRSLLNAPPLAQVLESWLQILSNQQLSTVPTDLDSRLGLLFEQLRQHRCLLILDNAESLMQEEQRSGEYRPGYEDYSQLIRHFGEGNHQSCLMLTSREKPREFTRLERGPAPVKSLQLTGLDLTAGQAILQEKGLTGSNETTQALINRYSGNPLALILVADTVHELFDGDITAFLSDETAIFEDIRDVLNQQFGRLTALEQAVMVWLAIEREPASIQTLAGNLVPTPVQSQLLEVVRSLQRRSLIEKLGDGWRSQNVVTEYVTDRLVRRVCQEIEQENLDWFNRHALIKAQAKEYVRQSQERLILRPVGDWLLTNFTPAGARARLSRLLELVRSNLKLPAGYAGGNILNLFLHLKIDCEGYDFSGLTVWQAYLQGTDLPRVNFASADLAGSAFTVTFSHVLSIAFSPDGRLLAARTGDEEVHLWQVADGQLKTVFSAPYNRVWPVIFSPDGRSLASGDADVTIRLWDPQTGQVDHTLSGHTHRIWTMAFSPDGRWLASGSEDQTIRLWDAHSGQPLHTLTGHTQAVWSVVFSPDGRLLASGSADRTIRLWHVQTGQMVTTLTDPEQRVWSVAFSPDGRWLAGGGEEQSIRLWNIAGIEPRTIEDTVQTLKRHTGTVYSVTFSPDGRWLASGSADRTVRLWDVRHDGPQAIKTLRGHTQEVRSIAFSPTDEILASSGWDQSIRLWDLRTDQTLWNLQGYRKGVKSVAFSPDNRFLACGSQDQRIHAWNLADDDSENVHTLRGHTNLVFQVAFSPDGRTLASGSSDQTIRLWDLPTGQLIKTLTWRGRGTLAAMALAADGRFLASGSTSDQQVSVWNIRTGQIHRTLPGHTNWIRALAFHPDLRSNLLASGSEDRTIRLWDLRQSGQPTHTLEGHTHGVWSIAFSPDGCLLASGSEDRTIRLWDLRQAGQLLHTLVGHINSVHHLAISPDGALLASASEDQTIRLWDLRQAGRLIRTMQGHINAVWSVAFSPTGETLVSGGADETIKFWAVDTGICLKTLRPPGPYQGMNIAGARGLTMAQRTTLTTLGAVEDFSHL